MAKKSVTIGECYCKVEAPTTLWVVSRMIDIPEAGEHVQMVQHDHPRRTLTVSLSALLDKTIFRQVAQAT